MKRILFGSLNGNVKFILIAFSLSVILTSCGSSKKAQRDALYLQGNLDTLPNLNVVPKELIIQKGDLLSITIYSDNLDATSIYNQRQASSGSKSFSTAVSVPAGYLVDNQGNINFQSFGSLYIEGLTKNQLAELLIGKLKVFLQNPYAEIRFLNFRISVFGEVQKPAVYTIPEEKISILELIAMAGDLTIYGKRDNVLVIREQNGQRQFGRLDLRKPDLFQSPYFYLQQNDRVVVEQNSKKQAANDQTTVRNISVAATLLSTLAILFSVFK